MSDGWQYQLRIYLPAELARVARMEGRAPELRPLVEVLDAHGAAMLSQLDAFEAYVTEAEREGVDGYPLYRWTKATVEDPDKRLKHLKAFALHVAGREVYPVETADALEAALRPLVVVGLIERLSRHDTNPANNLPVPPEYRG
jgi:hypothetical protein